MIFFLNPKILVCDEDKTEVKIPLNWKSKNHLKSMYFGSLCAGADIAGGFSAMKFIKESGKNVHLSFKDFKAEFLKRAEADTHFICEQNDEIKRFVQEVISTPNVRKEFPLRIKAVCPKISSEEVARFELLLSLKFKAIDQNN